ncbi:SAF domain-containing protein [Raineyella fluvialis]|uniref:SAF domain-containing protein n=1 Tax=Raineyella fluvialis TaxID=2662261 RepID=UPI00188DC835|nr:SAF domain-containing protein [Raineyella fluvialis]
MPTATPHSPSLLSWTRALRRFVAWHRRSLAAVLTFVAVLGALRVFAAPPGGGAQVVVLTADVTGGSALSRTQLTLRSVPPDLVPGGAVTALDQAEGRTPAGPLTAGTILTASALVGPGLAGLSSGHVAVPARLADPGIVAVLRVGDVIDVLATDPSSGEVRRAATRARVASIPAQGDTGPLSASSSQDVLVLLDVTAQEAVEVTRAAATARLSVVLPGSSQSAPQGPVAP